MIGRGTGNPGPAILLSREHAMEQDAARHRNPFLNRRIFVLAMLVGLTAGLLVLRRGGYVRIPAGYLRWVEIVVTAFAAFLVANVLVKLTEKRLFHLFEEEMEIEARIFITKIYTGLLYLVAIAVVLSRAGIAIEHISIFLGLAATGGALVVRDALSSHFIWLIVLAKKPFRIGDCITFGDETGRVSRIGTYFVTLEPDDREDGRVIKIPVKLLLDRPLVNHGAGGTLYETVSLPLSRVPAAPEKSIDRARDGMEKSLGSGADARVWLGPGPAVFASYRTPVGARRESSAAAVIALSRAFGPSRENGERSRAGKI